jgi:NAD(P)H-flavin reductase
VAKIIYQTRLERITSVTPLLRELVFKVQTPSEFKFQAGQFVMMNVPDPGSEKPLLRAYSLASDDRDTRSFKLLIKLIEDGQASQFIKNLKNGDRVDFTGPFGKLFFKQPAAPRVVMLCTGAGLSQHMSFLLSHGSKFLNTDFHLFIGVWNESEIFYQKELENLKSQTLPRLKYEFILDKPKADWKGKVGYVTDELKNFNLVEPKTDVYLCGNPHMIKGAKEYLKNLSFPTENLFAESFG